MFYNIGQLMVLVAGLNLHEIHCSSVYTLVVKYLKTKHLMKSLVTEQWKRPLKMEKLMVGTERWQLKQYKVKA